MSFTNPDALRVALDEGLGPIVVDEVEPGVLRVLVPNTRRVHDALSVIVRYDEFGAIVSDTGELSALASEDLPGMIDLLNCAGADMEMVDGLPSMLVDEITKLPSAVLSLTHYLAAAPVVWHARRCITDVVDEGEPSPRASVSSTRLMAQQTKDRLVQQFGDPARHLVRLHSTVTARGETAKPPLAIRSAKLASPRLVASFVDMTASTRSTTAAKVQAEWMFSVTRELNVPKYLVVRGQPSDVDHMGEFYDRGGVTVVDDASPDSLVETVDDTLRELIPA